jgi:dihydroorotate dehydrogenase electron transfer subunit
VSDAQDAMTVAAGASGKGAPSAAGCTAAIASMAVQVETEVEAHDRMARDTYRARFEAPEIASTIVPGQFVMLRLRDCSDPLIGRALALWDVVEDGRGRPRGVEVVYIAKGKFTSRLRDLGVGTKLTVWGPLGNGFQPVEATHWMMVAGGIGQTPFYALGQEALGRKRYGNRAIGYAKRATLIYGARQGDLLAGLDHFVSAGLHVFPCTDDGSVLPKARVPELLEFRLQSQQQDESLQLACCGPEAMMEKVAQMAVARGLRCQVSLETPMACGIGICFSCVAKIKQQDERGWDYKRTCVEGPIFDASEIVW